jgi:exosome complex protein LRP1
MDPQTDLPDLVEDLEVNIDELLSSLRPLLPPHSLQKTAQSLPLLEKAKLHTLVAYAIESTLFSALQLSGADAKAHPLFAELGRLKGYFAKIKDAETFFNKQEERDARARLDVPAAQRFIKHGLAGNERYDALRKERVEGEKARALEKARRLTNRRFEEEAPRKRAAEGEETSAKRARVEGGESEEEEEEEEEDEEKKIAREVDEDDDDDDDEDEAMDLDAPAPAKKKRGRPSKKDKAAAAAAAAGATPQKDTPTRATRSSAPKTRSEAFQALAEGSPAAAKGKGKEKGKGKGKAKGKKEK